MTRREGVWYVGLGLAGASLVLAALAQCRWSESSALLALFLGAAVLLGLSRQVRLSAEEYHSVYTLEDVPVYSLIFLCGWAQATLVVAVARLAFEVARVAQAVARRPDRVTAENVLFHFADVPMTIAATACTGLIYQAINGSTGLLESPRNLLAIGVASLVWFGLAFALNAVNVTLRRRRPLGTALAVMASNLRCVRLQVTMLVPLGALMALFLMNCPPAVVLLVVPVVMMHSTLEARHKLLSESQATIQSLAQYLEERDQYTLGHSQRVSGYAAAVAEYLGLPRSEVQLVRRAGLIHDIGKIDIPDAILRKPGGLTPEERDVMRTHTDRAVELGRKLVALKRDLPFDVAAYHHENYDGSGHFRLKGEQIPLASRILAVADTFDAITSDRPYRRGLSETEALARLLAARGSQLDPVVVDAFMKAHAAGAVGRVRDEWRESQPPLQTVAS